MNSMVADGDLSLMTSLTLEVGGLVHVAIDATANASYSISGSEMVRTPVHGQAFILKGLLQGSDMVSDLFGFSVVSAEILNLTL